MPRYYVIRRVPYSSEDLEFGFFDAKDEDEMNEISEELDDNPYLGTITILDEDELEKLKSLIDNPENWNKYSDE